MWDARWRTRARRALVALVTAMVVAGSFGDTSAGTSGGERTPVPILMYHVIGDPPAAAPFPDLYVGEADFAAQMGWLHRNGFRAVTLRQVWEHWQRGRPLPRRPVVVSFDDGYRTLCWVRGTHASGEALARCPQPHRQEPPRRGRPEPVPACPAPPRCSLGAGVAHASTHCHICRAWTIGSSGERSNAPEHCCEPDSTCPLTSSATRRAGTTRA